MKNVSNYSIKLYKNITTGFSGEARSNFLKRTHSMNQSCLTLSSAAAAYVCMEEGR